VACAAGEWDMCRNGKYTERGIKERNGFGSERWRIEPEFAVKLDENLRDVGVLMEPASILAKAWDHIQRIGQRAIWKPKTVLITGAGPVGLMAALIGQERGFELHVLDRIKEGLKPDLVRELGATYHTGPVSKIGFRPDVVIECTGVSSVITEAMMHLGNDSILCLIGVSSEDQKQTLDLGSINKSLVLDNCAIFGSVNANRKHYALAQKALLGTNRKLLSRLISRRFPVDNFASALQRHPDDIKVVIDFAAN
jgi:glucose 1-dehydrogenase